VSTWSSPTPIAPLRTAGPPRVLVVGTGGLFGSALTDVLVREGFLPIVHREPGEADSSESRSVTVWRASLAQAAANEEVVVPQADAVIIAWPVGEEDATPEKLVALAVERFNASFEVGQRTGVQRWIVLSGIEAAGPLHWEQGLAYESVKPDPAVHVGGALREMERHAMLQIGPTGDSLVILRAGHVYGDGNPGFLDQVVRILGGADRELVRAEWSNRRFQPVHVRDVASAAVLAVTRGEGIYHVTDGTCPTVGQIVRDVEGVGRMKGFQLPRVRAPLRARPSSLRIHYAYPPDRAVRDLGYRPGWTLSAGTAALVDQLNFTDRAGGLSELVRKTRGEGVKVADPDATGGIYSTTQDWVEDENLRDVLHRPVSRFIHRALRSVRARRVLDFGCEDGTWSRALIRGSGVRIVGVDSSEENIRQAREQADVEGLADDAEYHVGNPADFSVEEPVDAVLCYGALGHFSDIEQDLPAFLERILVPGGLLVAIERHCDDGYHPSLLRLMRNASGSWARRLFDLRRYEDLIQSPGLDPVLEAIAGPARSGRWLQTRFSPVRAGHAHFLSPFAANSLVVFQRSRRIRGMARFVMPALVRVDDWLCRFPQFKAWAALGMYAVKWEGR